MFVKDNMSCFSFITGKILMSSVLLLLDISALTQSLAAVDSAEVIQSNSKVMRSNSSVSIWCRSVF